MLMMMVVRRGGGAPRRWGRPVLAGVGWSSRPKKEAARPPRVALLSTAPAGSYRRRWAADGKLAARLGRAETSDEVLALFAARKQDFSEEHLALAFGLIARFVVVLHKKGGGAAQQRDEWLRLLERRTAASLGTFPDRWTPRMLATVAGAATAFGRPAPVVYGHIARVAMPRLRAFPPTDLADLALAYARADPPLCGPLKRAQRRRQEQQQQQESEGGADEEVEVPDLVDALFEAFEATVRSRGVADWSLEALARTAAAFAAAGYDAKGLFAAIGAKVADDDGDYARLAGRRSADPSHLVLLASSLARAGVASEAAFADFNATVADVAAARAGDLSPVDYAAVCEAFATTGFAAPSLFVALGRTARQKGFFDPFGAAELVTVATAFARLRRRFPANFPDPLFHALARAADASLAAAAAATTTTAGLDGAWTPRHLVDLVDALAEVRCGTRPFPLYDGLFGLVADRLLAAPDDASSSLLLLGPRDRGRLLRAFSEAQVQAPDLFAAVGRATRAALARGETYDLAALAAVAWALAAAPGPVDAALFEALAMKASKNSSSSDLAKTDPRGARGGDLAALAWALTTADALDAAEPFFRGLAQTLEADKTKIMRRPTDRPTDALWPDVLLALRTAPNAAHHDCPLALVLAQKLILEGPPTDSDDNDDNEGRRRKGNNRLVVVDDDDDDDASSASASASASSEPPGGPFVAEALDEVARALSRLGVGDTRPLFLERERVAIPLGSPTVKVAFEVLGPFDYYGSWTTADGDGNAQPSPPLTAKVRNRHRALERAGWTVVRVDASDLQALPKRDRDDWLRAKLRWSGHGADPPRRSSDDFFKRE